MFLPSDAGSRASRHCRFVLTALPILAAFVVATSWGPGAVRAQPAPPAGAPARLLLDVGVAAPSDLTAGTRNPAGLARVHEGRRAYFDVIGASGPESWDASKYHSEQRGEDDYESPDKADHFDGDTYTSRVDLSIVQALQPGWAFRVYAGATRRFEQIDAATYAYAVDHRSWAGVGFATGQDMGGIFGGTVSLGLGLDVELVQNTAQDIVDSMAAADTHSPAYQELVVPLWRKGWFDSPDPDLGFTSVVGAQWRRAVGGTDWGEFAAGLVLRDLASLRPGGGADPSARFGLSLATRSRYLPTLAADAGQFRGLEEATVSGVGASATWILGSLRLAASVRPDARAAGIGLSGLGFQLSYGLLRLADDTAPALADRTQHVVSIGFSPSFERGGAR